RPPFLGENMMETLEQVCQREPVPVRQLRPGVPLDLETIALKCLKKEPRRRYASAAELAADLERFQRGEPILARPTAGLERALKWSRRHPAVASLSALLVSGALLALVVVTGLWRQAVKAEGDAREAEGQARQLAIEEKDARVAEAAAKEEARLRAIKEHEAR